MLTENQTRWHWFIPTTKQRGNYVPFIEHEMKIPKHNSFRIWLEKTFRIILKQANFQLT